MKVILNSHDITDTIEKVVIQEGTQHSEVLIVKIHYLDKKVDTKVSIPIKNYKTHVLVKRDT